MKDKTEVTCCKRIHQWSSDRFLSTSMEWVHILHHQSSLIWAKHLALKKIKKKKERKSLKECLVMI